MRVFEGFRPMKYVAVLLACLSRAALAGGAPCDAHTPAELRTVFTVAVGLSEALLRANAGSETAVYQELRARLADYDGLHTLPCAAAAVELLRTAPDGALGQSLLELVSSRAHSEARIPPQAPARFLAARPDDFRDALARMPMADRCAVVDSVEAGWLIMNPTMTAATGPTMAAEHAGVDDGLVANLRRVYCRAPNTRPAVEAPSNRARNRAEPERRPSRPRYARAASGLAQPARCA